MTAEPGGTVQFNLARSYDCDYGLSSEAAYTFAGHALSGGDQCSRRSHGALDRQLAYAEAIWRAGVDTLSDFFTSCIDALCACCQ